MLISFIEEDFRRTLMGIEQENVNLRIEIASLKAASTQQKRKISALEGHLCKTETQIDHLLSKLNSANEMVRSLQQEVRFVCMQCIRNVSARMLLI